MKIQEVKMKLKVAQVKNYVKVHTLPEHQKVQTNRAKKLQVTPAATLQTLCLSKAKTQQRALSQTHQI